MFLIFLIGLYVKSDTQGIAWKRTAENRGIFCGGTYGIILGKGVSFTKTCSFLDDSDKCVYRYTYDGLQRLTGVEKDGKPLRSYQYDAFGNRTELQDYARGTRSTYGYDALNHLLEQETWQGEDSVIHKKYTYDKRGNLTGEYQDGGLLHGYVYDSMNRLQKAWDSQGEEAEYFYNALGQRTGRSTRGQMEEYLLDLTKPYHNLLELRRGNHKQIFYWDITVSAMEDENRIMQYYLSDELGSPLRVLYRNGNGDAYGYDEFGVDLYDPEVEQYKGKRYSRQGERQPFGYTGYRHDDISGTYFAQAREYQPEVGRFTAEDIMRGRNTMPKTLNRYGYCWGEPVSYIDLDGRDPITPQDVQDEFWKSLAKAADQAFREIGSDIKTGIADASADVTDNVIDKVVGTYDEYGQEILNRYIYGDGSPYIINDDAKWSDYIKSNEYITKWTGEYLAPIGDNLMKGESKVIDMQISMLVQGNNNTGYMLLNGSNANVGGYQIQGTVSKDIEGTVIYDMKYTFNDIADPEFRYQSDRVNYEGLRLLQKFDHNVTMNVFDLHLSWYDKTIIYADGVQNEGWLANMNAVDVAQQLSVIQWNLDAIKGLWWKKNDVKAGLLTQQIYTDMQNYMREHPEYYGCSE